MKSDMSCRRRRRRRRRRAVSSLSSEDTTHKTRLYGLENSLQSHIRLTAQYTERLQSPGPQKTHDDDDDDNRRYAVPGFTVDQSTARCVNEWAVCNCGLVCLVDVPKRS